MRPAILAIDLGTTSLKGILVDERGVRIDRESVNQIVPATVEGWFRLLRSIVSTMRQRQPECEILALSITGQMHGTQIYDRDHKPSAPCQLWTDRSAARHLPSLLEAVGPELPLRVGSTIAPGFQALNLFARSSWDDVTHVLLPKDALIHRLTGNYVTDPSDAAGTGLFDSGASEWAWDIVDALNIPRHILPNVVASGDCIGTLTPDVADALGLSAETRVIIAGGDTPVAALGAGTMLPGDMQIMLSTSAQVLMPCATWDPHPTAKWYTWPAARSNEMSGSRWLRSGTLSNGGSVIDWLVSIQDSVPIEDVTPTPIIVLPHLAGRRFPVSDPAASGAMLGLRSSHSATDLYAATLQGIAFSFREVAEALLEDQDQPTHVRFGGGGSQIPGFSQLLADVLDHPIERIGGSDLTCDGAAILAADHLGWTPKRPIPGTIFEPDRSRHRAFTNLYEIYLDANSAVLPISHRLQALT